MKIFLLLLACLAASASVTVSAHAGPAARHDKTVALTAHAAGRHAESLGIIKQTFAGIAPGVEDGHEDYFVTMLAWGLLSHDYAPAREAMIGERDDQVRKLLDGDAVFLANSAKRISRFQVIVEMNQDLGDNRSTYGIFTRLLADHPQLAKEEASRALPAIVAAGDYALAAQYIRSPLPQLDLLNSLAKEEPLLPAHFADAPRLAAMLNIYLQDVAMLDKVLQGQGKDAEAAALRQAALTGIHSDELRAMAARELELPGTLSRTVSEHVANLAPALKR